MSISHPHIWKFFPEPTHDQQEFMRLAGLLGEREGGPMRFESTPREGPNPYYERYFPPKPLPPEE